jgi:hypothetical protein
MTSPAWNQGFAALETCVKSDMISPYDQNDDTDGYRMNSDSSVFTPAPRSRASSATPELGFVEGLKNKIRVLQRRAYRLRAKEYLRLKILPCMLPAI